MKKILAGLILILLFPSLLFAEVPVNNFSDKVTNPDGTITQSIYSYPKYYDNNGNLEIVDSSVVASSDVGWDWEVKKGVYKLRIKNDGTFEVNHLGDVFSLKFNGLGFFNTDTKQRVAPAQTQVTMSNPTVSGNSITWSLAGGSSYKIEYINDTLKDILTIGNTARNFLKNNKPNGWTVENTWVGLIYDIDLSGSTMIESNDIESDNGIDFKSEGKIKHRFKEAWAFSTNYQEPSYDDNGLTNPTESSLKWKRKRIIKNGKYIEAIKAEALDVNDNGNIVFNTDISFQEGVSPSGSYTGTEDTTMNSSNTTTNYGNSTTLTAKWQFASHAGRPLIRFNVSDIPSNATVSSATLTIKSGTSSNACVWNAFRVFKPWVEGDGTSDTSATWNDWNAPNSEWASAGAGNADDGGSDNSGDGTGADRTATSESNSTISSNTMTFNLTTAVQNWVSGSWTNNGVIIMLTSTCGATDGITIHSSEAGTSSNRPLLEVTYTVASGDRRTIMLLD